MNSLIFNEDDFAPSSMTDREQAPAAPSAAAAEAEPVSDAASAVSLPICDRVEPIRMIERNPFRHIGVSTLIRTPCGSIT